MIYTRRTHLTSLLASLSLPLGLAVKPALAADQPFNGTWTGLVESGNIALTLRLVIDGDTVTLVSPDQGGASIKANEVTITGGHIVVAFKPIGARFEGDLAADGHIDGTFTQGRATRLRLTRGDVADGSSWPPLTPALLDSERLKANAPAMGAAWSSGKTSDLFVKGVRSSASNVAVQPQDQWHWGSITKSMTATLCARLVEKGVIRWDTTVGEVLDAPGVPVPQDYRNATLLHLLSHRAGLQSNIAETGFSLELKDAREERLKYARFALNQKPVGAIGAQMSYANNGYIVTGAMLERLTGKSWETLIQAEVFKPLGIKHAGQGAPGTPGRIDQPLGHAITDGKRVPQPVGGPDSDNVAAMGPAGRVHMPLADMLTYLKAHRDRPAKFLKTESWTKLHTPPFGGNYALGWFVRTDGALWHNGSNTVWIGEALVDVKKGAVCVACANDAAPETMTLIDDVLMSARAAAIA